MRGKMGSEMIRTVQGATQPIYLAHVADEITQAGIVKLLPYLMLLELIPAEDDQLPGVVSVNFLPKEPVPPVTRTANSFQVMITTILPEPDGSVTAALQLQAFEYRRQPAMGLTQVRWCLVRCYLATQDRPRGTS